MYSRLIQNYMIASTKINCNIGLLKTFLTIYYFPKESPKSFALRQVSICGKD